MTMSKSRLVLDTNFVVSAALLEHSFARKVFEKALRYGEILISNETQNELTSVMMRPKFDRYVAEDKRLRFLANFLSIASVTKITEQIDACRDPKDNKFLALAVSGRADAIITGDKDLLILNPFRNVEILTLEEFMSRPVRE